MKKFFAAMVMLAVLVPAAAWAGRSNLLSEPELDKIELVARAAYPQGTQVYMVVDDDFLGRFAVIKFIKKDNTLSLRLEVYPYWARMSDAENDKVGERVGVKVIEVIEKILNEKPRTALGRNLLERQGVK
jgi:hypothetical protein